MKTKQLVRNFLSILAGLAILVTISACSGPSIDGNWTSPSAAKEMYDEGLKDYIGNAFEYSDHSIEDIMTGTEVNLVIKEDKATFELVLDIDEEMFVTALKDEQQAAVEAELANMGLTYDGLSAEEKAELDAGLASDEDLRELVKTVIEGMASEMGGTYQSDKGHISGTLFKANVDRGSKTLDITEVDNTIGGEFVVQGESYQYTYKDGKLILEGETDEYDMVFEKK